MGKIKLRSDKKMKFEILTEQNFNNNFGSHVRCESLWTEIEESVVDLLLYTRYKDEAEDIKKEGEVFLREQMNKYFPNNKIEYIV